MEVFLHSDFQGRAEEEELPSASKQFTDVGVRF